MVRVYEFIHGFGENGQKTQHDSDTDWQSVWDKQKKRLLIR